jgi:hypothetical protein
MATTITNKRICSGTLSDSNATLYTAPSTSGLITVIKSISLCNKTAGAVTVTIKLDGLEIICDHTIAAYDTYPFKIDQIIEATELIEGSASAAASVTYYISGRDEITT